MFENLIKLLLLLFNVPCFIHTKNNNKLGCTEHIKKDKRERRTARERWRERRTWSEVSEGSLQRPLVMSWSVLSSSWSFGTERNVFFCPYLAKSWPAILGPRPLKMRHKWPVWATLSFTPTGERSRKKKSDAMTQVLIDGFRQKERERGKGKRKGWVDKKIKERVKEKRTFFMGRGWVTLFFELLLHFVFRSHFTCAKTKRAFKYISQIKHINRKPQDAHLPWLPVWSLQAAQSSSPSLETGVFLIRAAAIKSHLLIRF